MLFFIAILNVFSCNSISQKISETNGPQWTKDPYSFSKDIVEIVGIGSAKKNQNGNIRDQIKEAEINAKNYISKVIFEFLISEEKNIIKDLKSSSYNSEEFSKISKQIATNIPFKFAVRTHIWQNMDTEEIFVRISIDKFKITNYLDSNLNNYDDKLNDQNFVQAFKINITSSLNSTFETKIKMISKNVKL